MRKNLLDWIIISAISGVIVSILSVLLTTKMAGGELMFFMTVFFLVMAGQNIVGQFAVLKLNIKNEYAKIALISFFGVAAIHTPFIYGVISGEMMIVTTTASLLFLITEQILSLFVANLFVMRIYDKIAKKRG